MGKAFSDVQLGFERHGTEKIIHSVRLCTEVHREYDAAFPDGINAFNNSSREAALDTHTHTHIIDIKIKLVDSSKYSY